MDNYSDHHKSLSAPADTHYTITPDDTADLPRKPRSLYCTAAGDVVIRDGAGTEITYPVVMGQVLPFRGQRIMAAGTTATVVGWE